MCVAAYKTQPTETPLPTQPDVPQDYQTLSQEIDNIFLKDAPAQASSDVAKDYLGRIDTLSAQLSRERAELDERVNGPWYHIQGR